mmetsp:Transcript_13426/g.22333  ORF Transcript_13426/g.22333 Transcript_13426/m.22333 type:complete len:315 (-) Transcript_13426:1159-2103(-)
MTARISNGFARCRRVERCVGGMQREQSRDTAPQAFVSGAEGHRLRPQRLLLGRELRGRLTAGRGHRERGGRLVPHLESLLRALLVGVARRVAFELSRRREQPGRCLIAVVPHHVQRRSHVDGEDGECGMLDSRVDECVEGGDARVEGECGCAGVALLLELGRKGGHVRGQLDGHSSQCRDGAHGLCCARRILGLTLQSVGEARKPLELDDLLLELAHCARGLVQLVDKLTLDAAACLAARHARRRESRVVCPQPRRTLRRAAAQPLPHLRHPPRTLELRDQRLAQRCLGCHERLPPLAAHVHPLQLADEVRVGG